MTAVIAPDARFVLGLEEECLTVVGRQPGPPSNQFRFLQLMAELAPSLAGTNGFFNAYGRVYEDVNGHLEFASLECDSPYRLAGAIETQYALAGEALRRLRAEGRELSLGTTKHSGLLRAEAASWGWHENYRIECPAQELAELMLPFLASRLYGGSGGLLYPSGDYVASPRALFLERETGGSTTGSRALYSTAREEHHMGPCPSARRLHLISGDSLRSQFNLALVVGATALALKEVQSTSGLLERVADLRVRARGESWLGALRRWNRLGSAGELPRVSAGAIAVQRVYLEAAEDWAASPGERPDWIPVLLHAWRRTLDALASDERDWLALVLDSFIKWKLLDVLLTVEGRRWSELRDDGGDRALFSRLALHEQAYQRIAGSGEEPSLFERLEAAGVIEARVAPRVAPGSEREAFVPEVGTRARARARFIKENDRRPELLLDWSRVVDAKAGRVARLLDPFAERYGDWEAPSRDGLLPHPLAGDLEEFRALLDPGLPFRARPSSRRRRRTESG